MGDMLSQAEIDALLGGSSSTADPEPESQSDSESQSDLDALYGDILSTEQKDILGEIGNISMGTAATTLFALLNQKVWITTPKVSVRTWKDLTNGYDRPCVGIKVDYKLGLQGSNILLLKEHDVKVITSLMMGGDGTIDESAPLSELELSAIGEAMNQMVGSSSTSLSSMIKTTIDIDTPHAFILDFKNDTFFESVGFLPEDIIVYIAFKMEIGTLIDSEIMQILPVEFAKDMVEKLKNEMFSSSGATPTEPSVDSGKTAQQEPAQEQPVYQQPQQPVYQQAYDQSMYQQPQQPMYQQPVQQPQQPMYQQPVYDQSMYQQPQQPMYQQPVYQQPPQQPVNVQAAQFQNFDVSSVMQQKENIEIIMDVPLEVTVELGRTKKKIKEILEFSPGSIIELDKLAGEPIDILVNGKFVAKGEVVVIDENFGIRITDIISVDKRI